VGIRNGEGILCLFAREENGNCLVFVFDTTSGDKCLKNLFGHQGKADQAFCGNMTGSAMLGAWCSEFFAFSACAGSTQGYS